MIFQFSFQTYALNTKFFELFTIEIIQCVTDGVKLITKKIIALTSTCVLLHSLSSILLAIFTCTIEKLSHKGFLKVWFVK